MNCFEHTTRVFFEISNMCNLHCPKCPRTFVPGRENRFGLLHTWVIQRTLRNLKNNGFTGNVCFNLFNEPMIDPRLFLLVAYTKNLFGESVKVHIVSNGHYIDKQMLRELETVGVDILCISTYTQSEMDRCKKLKASFKIRLWDRELNPQKDLSDLYTRAPIPCNDPCVGPLGAISIDHRGDVLLCCLDYESRHVFGNINRELLSAIVEKGKMYEAYSELMKGDRTREMCRRCGFSMGSE